MHPQSPSATPVSHRPPYHRLLWSGLLSPLIVTVSIIGESLTRPSVNPVQESISLLIEGSQGRVLRIALVLGGALMLVYAWGLHLLKRHPASVVKGQAAIGIGLATSGLFIQQGLAPRRGFRVPSPWGYLTAVGLIHVIGGLILYLAIVDSCFAVARHGPRHRPGGRWAHRYSLASGIVMLGLLALFVLTAAIGGPSGLMERLVALVAILWEVWLVVGSVRHAYQQPA